MQMLNQLFENNSMLETHTFQIFFSPHAWKFLTKHFRAGQSVTNLLLKTILSRNIISKYRVTRLKEF